MLCDQKMYIHYMRTHELFNSFIEHLLMSGTGFFQNKMLSNKLHCTAIVVY